MSLNGDFDELVIAVDKALKHLDILETLKPDDYPEWPGPEQKWRVRTIFANKTALVLVHVPKDIRLLNKLEGHLKGRGLGVSHPHRSRTRRAHNKLLIKPISKKPETQL